jgi:glycosyltransferase involved in cell wall biosynthesis
MRVAIIGSYPKDSSHLKGGVQAAFAYLVRGLQQHDDLQLHIITRWRDSHSGVSEIERDGAVVHLMPPVPRFDWIRGYPTYQSQLNELLARIQPQLVHAQGSDYHGYVAARSRCPAVITVHGILREDTKHSGNRIARLRAQAHALIFERYTLSHVHHLIAISRYVTTYFSSLLQAEAQVYHIPNAIDESYFTLEDVSDGSTILFAGRVCQRKRPLDLVKAFGQIAQRLPKVQLRIAGELESAPAYVEEIHAVIRETGLDDRVHLLGSLPEQAILREFAACDVLALPSIQETTPMVIAQAMAAGKAVVATPVGGVPEMVHDGDTGFLIPVGDVDGLASALLRLLQDPALCARIGQAGRQFAQENYQMASVAKRTYDVYRSITATRRA